jgi:Uma2 family endonuclease
VAPVTLDEFLAMPDTRPPTEYWNGEVVQKPFRSYREGRLVATLGADLYGHLLESGEGVAVLHVTCVDRDYNCAYLPDISVVLRAHIPRRDEWNRPLFHRPDIAIYLQPADSSGDRRTRWAAVAGHAGIPLTWFIDPNSLAVTVYRPGTQPRAHQPPNVIDALPVLRDFKLDLAALFAELADD